MITSQQRRQPAIAVDEVADAVEANLERERVRRCLDTLTDIQRESVTLAYYGGYSYREVAGLLSVASRHHQDEDPGRADADA